MNDELQRADGEQPGGPGPQGPAAAGMVDTRAAAQRRWWTVGLVAFIVLVVVTVAVFVAGGDDDSATDGTPSISAPTSSSDSMPTDPSTGNGGTVVESSTVVSQSTPPSSGSSVEVGTSEAGTSTTLIGSTPVSPPVSFVPGNGDTVPVQTVVTAPPVSINEVADPGTGMRFRLDRLEAVPGEANGPGEIAGPAVRVTVAATNETGAPVVLETIVVDLVYGTERTSAAPLSGPGVQRFAGELAPGSSATGVYVFDVPVDQRAEISVIVSYTAAVSPVVFTGPAPTP